MIEAISVSIVLLSFLFYCVVFSIYKRKSKFTYGKFIKNDFIYYLLTIPSTILVFGVIFLFLIMPFGLAEEWSYLAFILIIIDVVLVINLRKILKKS